MPYGQYFEAIRSNSVVDPVPDAIKVESPHVGRACFLNARAYVRLNKQDIDGSLQILADCAWSSRPVGSPPLDDALDLARCGARWRVRAPQLPVAT